MKLITFAGKTQCIEAWAKEFDINHYTLKNRLSRSGWPIEKALTKPVRKPGDKPDSLLISLYRKKKSFGRYTTMHVSIAEAAIGKKLPRGAIVHHINYEKLDNRPSNLVICNSDAYHKIIHMRTDALNACGNANFRFMHRMSSI